MKATLNISMSEISPIIKKCITNGSEVILTVTGNSMRPFLKDKRDQVVLIKAKADSLNIGDVPLYCRRNGKFVLHRIVGIENGSYTMLGDAQVIKEPGIEPDQIVAVAKAFIRKGKRYECDGKSYKRYVRFWNNMMPERKFYFKLRGVAARIYYKIKQIKR
ncbi:MAG: S24/S26 family peptidase [Clostridia bacterium]|nr:S24/S26 family peptidase [Clostridia bacterium]